jgi:large subunit ribosomal protein L9
MAVTEVILIENVPGLGAEADVVKVKAGYARNFLLPQGKAYEVTPVTLKKLNQLKAKRAEREAREVNEADELARKINKLNLTLTLATGETGKAFGSITATDIAEKLKGELGGIEIERHKIDLERPIIFVKSDNEENPAGEETAEGTEDKGFKAKHKARHSK